MIVHLECVSIIYRQVAYRVYQLKDCRKKLGNITQPLTEEKRIERIPFGLAELGFSMLLFGGILKGQVLFSWLPFDITVLGGAITALFTFYFFLKNGIHPNGLLIVSPLFLFALLHMISVTNPSDYASRKAEQYITLTFISCIYPLAAITDRLTLRKHIWAIAFILMLFSLEVVITIPLSGGDTTRLTAHSGGPLGTARGLGLTAIFLFVAFIRFRRHLVLGVVVISTLLFFLTPHLLGTASRGPLLSVFITMLIAAFSTLKPGMRGRIRSILVILTSISFVIMTANSEVLPSQNTNRLFSFIADPSAVSEESRSGIYSESVQVIIENPLGIGIGNFAEVLHLPGPNGFVLTYPHNIFLEYFLEFGWITGVWAIVLMVRVLVYAYIENQKSSGQLSFYLFAYLFVLLAAQFSFDLNGNRIVLALAMAGISLLLRERSSLSLIHESQYTEVHA